MITLRGHHLLCSLHYSGKGYTPEFIENFDACIAAINDGAPVRLTWGPDRICQPMIGHPNCHCHNLTIPVRDFFGFLMTSIVLRRLCFPPRVMTLDTRAVERLRSAFRIGLIRPGCIGCPWFFTCSRTAKAGNLTSKLKPKE
jgi:hypothetical protein